MIPTLDKKLWRDLNAARTQLGAIALVLAAGLGLFLGMRSTFRSLDAAQASTYAAERFGDVFSRLVRAPLRVADRLAAIPGVVAVEPRIVADVTVDLPNMVEAATARLVSLPERGEPAVNDLALVGGRFPDPLRGAEVVASKHFFAAHDLAFGDVIPALLEGRMRELRVVGTALAPEFTIIVPPGALFPDDRRHGVLWMRRDAMAPAFDLEGAFNDVVLRLAPAASEAAVIAAVDDILAPYGGLGAHGRDEQPSHAFVQSELDQLQAMGSTVPVLFLLVAAFLLNVVIGRHVHRQREIIAVLKALGLRDREVGWHYARLVAAVMVTGVLLGVVVGGWLGGTMCRLYAEYYRFPDIVHRLRAADVAVAVALTTAAAALGAWRAVRAAIRLPPAEAMRPAAPPSFRPTFAERIGLARHLPLSWRTVLRELERRPKRVAAGVFGVAAATALVIASGFGFAAMEHAMRVQFGLAERADVRLTIAEPRSLGALASVRHLPGVRAVEPMRQVPARLSNGPRSRTTAISGLAPDAMLQRAIDRELRAVPIPPGGLVLTRRLAEILGVGVGDPVTLEILEGPRPVRTARVVRLIDTFVGLVAYTRLDELARLLGETPTWNVALLEVDAAERRDLHRAVKQTPMIVGVAERDRMLSAWKRMFDENLGTSIVINLAFALTLALGVLYNTARVTADERARELASLRVLGFRRDEVAGILVGELWILVILGIPIGIAAGYASVEVMAVGLSTDQFRIPPIVAPRTIGLAVLSIAASAWLAMRTARRQVDRLDLCDVLKARD